MVFMTLNGYEILFRLWLRWQ